jgi:hypothetical protein
MRIAGTVCGGPRFSYLYFSNNSLTGTIPKSFATLKFISVIDFQHNLLTGNATLLVERFGVEPFSYNCFDPVVPPTNPSC